LTSGLQVSPSGIATAEVFGTAKLNQQIRSGSIASSEAFGTATLTSDALISPSGIASGQAFGTATITSGGSQVLTVSGIPSAERFGWTELTCRGIDWLEFGDPLEKPIGEKDELVFNYEPWLNGEKIASAFVELEPGIREIVLKEPVIDGPRLVVPYEIVGPRLPAGRRARILATARSDNTHRVASRRAVGVKIV
jgi:hypothetical protein